MKSKVRKIGFLIALLVLVAATLSACQLNDTLEDKKEEFNLNAVISYHANGGRIEDNENLLFANIYYRAGDKAMNLGIDQITDGNCSVVRSNYTLEGWYYPARNADGSIIYEDEQGDIAQLGNKFDFSTYTIKENDDIVLYANWLRNQKVNYLLAPEDKIDNKLVVGENVYTVGGTPVSESNFDRYSSIGEPTMDPLFGEAKNYTFVGYYTDAECTVPAKWPIKRTADGTDTNVYVKYLPSDWTVISTVNDLYKMFGKTVNTGKYYLKNNIDGKGMDINVAASATFSGMIEGNGYTISNVTFNNAKLQNSNVASIFGRIISGAKIANITIKDCGTNFKANFNSNIYAYYFAESIADDATITNVKIDGGELFVNTLSEGSSWLNNADNAPLCNGGEDRLTIVNAPTLSHVDEY